MKLFYILPLMFAITFGALPSAAQVSDADARLMENMAADEDGWTGTDEEGIELPGEPESKPLFQEEQNPQEGLRRMPVPQPPQGEAPQPQERGSQKLPGR